MLYWDIGRTILNRQRQEGWGAKVIDRLSGDLKKAFPDMKGFSTRNLLFMRSFADSYGDPAIVKQVVSQLPWGQLVRLLQLVKNSTVRLWYARSSIQHGWGRFTLETQVRAGAHRRYKARIGLLLCRSKKQLTVEYALRGLGKPIGVSAWKTELVERVPDELKASLPTATGSRLAGAVAILSGTTCRDR